MFIIVLKFDKIPRRFLEISFHMLPQFFFSLNITVFVKPRTNIKSSNPIFAVVNGTVYYRGKRLSLRAIETVFRNLQTICNDISEEACP